MAKDRIHSASKPDPTADHPKRMPDLEKEKKNVERMLLSLKPDDSEATQTGCQFQLACQQNHVTVCLRIKAMNELRLLFQEIQHTSQIFPHLFHERFIRPLFARLAVK